MKLFSPAGVDVQLKVCFEVQPDASRALGAVPSLFDWTMPCRTMGRAAASAPAGDQDIKTAQDLGGYFGQLA